jgi:hypothetical protein
MGWTKGMQSPYPAGRPKGVKRRLGVGEALLFRASQKGKPLVFLRGVMDCEQVPIPLRLVAAQALAPYEHVKATGQKISTPIDLPIPKNAHEAKGNIGIISAYALAGRLTLEEANQLILMQNQFIAAHAVETMEERLAVLEWQYAERPPAVSMTVVSDLPMLPGTNIAGIPHAADDPPPDNPWDKSKR